VIYPDFGFKLVTFLDPPARTAAVVGEIYGTGMDDLRACGRMRRAVVEG
jgi:hypothetical protein